MSRSSDEGSLFSRMIGNVTSVFAPKQHLDKQYNALSTEEEGRVVLSNNPTDAYREGDEASVALLHTEITKRHRMDRFAVNSLNCSFFCKVSGIIIALVLVWNAIKLIAWALAEESTVLETMPAFSSSLGCLAAPHIYNNSKVVMTARIGPEDDHSFDIRGSAFGTFVITQGDSSMKDVKYEMTLRSDDAELLNDISINYPDLDDDGTVLNSRLLINTPRTLPDAGCVRYDITIYIPPSLKKLHVASHTTMHIQFDPTADIELDKLFVTMFNMNKNNLILPSQGVRGNHMALEVFRGWIVGDVAIVNSTAITTQRGDGIANVRAHPTTPANPGEPDPAYLRTVTGAGRTDIFYVDAMTSKRPISSVHMSSRNADMYLTYREANFRGRVQLDSKSYATTGLQRFSDVSGDEEEGDSNRWTHWAADKQGVDEIFVKSRGWTGLYL